MLLALGVLCEVTFGSVEWEPIFDSPLTYSSHRHISDPRCMGHHFREERGACKLLLRVAEIKHPSHTTHAICCACNSA
jgi:hypothetical protein